MDSESMRVRRARGRLGSVALSPRALVLPIALTASLAPAVAMASNVSEFPDNGSEQMARGGAWVARASDPLATVYNPAGLAGQRTALTLQGNLTLQSTCMKRIKSANDTTQEPLADSNGGQFPEVCNDEEPFLNPQVAFAYRVSERLGLGLAILGPSGVGNANWPTFVNGPTGLQAAPQRYLLVKGNLFFLTPTIGAGFEVVKNLRIGAALSWGMTKAKFLTSAVGLNGDNQHPRANDVASTLIVEDMFVPSAMIGSIFSPTPWLDLGAWYKWTDTIRAGGDLYTQANYFTPSVASGDYSGIADGDTSLPDCGTGTGSTTCGAGNNARLEMPVPMEAKIGARYHRPRKNAAPSDVRDPIAQDVFDMELDLTWANNSAIDSIRVRFPGDSAGDGIIPINGTGGFLPPNADIPKAYKDVLGVRFGGDVNIIPDELTLRAGTFFETAAENPRYQSVDFMAQSRFGLSAGVAYRLRPFSAESHAALDLMVGYMHMFVADSKRTDPTADGLAATAGSPCNPAANNQGGATCADGTEKYRTNWPVNLGTITNAINALNVGVRYRF